MEFLNLRQLLNYLFQFMSSLLPNYYLTKEKQLLQV